MRLPNEYDPEYVRALETALRACVQEMEYFMADNDYTGWGSPERQQIDPLVAAVVFGRQILDLRDDTI